MAAWVEAIRVRPGEFLLATERIELGLEFTVAGSVYRVVDEPVSAGFRTAFAQVRIIEGLAAGREFRAYLQGGQRQA
ncbi:MAG TPA: hypothetical protein VGJ44_27120 [Kribbellaceae bacterium]